ncbi:hypothetical protein BDZ94DRAFT_1274857 [Collybia nuda]|uniref:F-box domain-containing protein n=1 Tax=Collybia nuda TaxID=64659 RepID=A0A9P5XU28_9AGAR|nr:hypothetical protein BDZ94DRAFT_1274857 [Collybia nuda]
MSASIPENPTCGSNTRSNLDKHRTSFSPIRHLPPEVLGEIFVRCTFMDFCRAGPTRALPFLMNVHMQSLEIGCTPYRVCLGINIGRLSRVGRLPDRRLIKLWREVWHTPIVVFDGC